MTDTQLNHPFPEMIDPANPFDPAAFEAEEVMAIHGGALMQNRRVYQSPMFVAHYVGYHGTFELKDVWPIQMADKALHLVVRAYNAEAATL